jgi:protein-tyrosine phosphatase
VSLLEREEEEPLVLRGEAAAARASGIEFTPFPIRDRGVPASLESVADLASRIIDALERGKSVAVHCRQDIGRSSVMVAAVLVAAGETPDNALRAIRESRGLEVPETEEQRRWLTDFASWLPTAPAANSPLQPPAFGAVERLSVRQFRL